MVSGWRKFSRGGRKRGLELVPGLLYGVRTILVTSLVAETTTAARGSRARLRAGIHARGGDEDDPLLDDFFTKGYSGLLGWLMGCGLGRAAGLLVG
jgi:hypothetical protein